MWSMVKMGNLTNIQTVDVLHKKLIKFIGSLKFMDQSQALTIII